MLTKLVLKRTLAVLLLLPCGLQAGQAQPAARTPYQLIEHLGVEVRDILDKDVTSKTPEGAERAVADQIAALIRGAEGHLSLTAPDSQGRTPLMLAVSGAHLPVVQALLTDPSVRLQINVPDADGVTAWMLANFAPALTLVSCQPGSLTLDRFQLLPPYLRRVSHLLKDKAATLSGIINALEAVGAEVKPDDAKQAWLARCPNASAELRAALADGRLMPTLVNHAIRRQMAFNKAVLENAQDVPARPPDDMKFLGISSPDRHVRREPELLQVHQMNCVWMEKPQMGKLNWRGMALFTAKAATRAGVVEAVDIELMPTNKPAPPPFVVAHFSRSIVRALAEYKCEGDHIFEQEFQFVID